MIKRLLIVEDDEVFAAGLVRAFSRRGYACLLASTCEEARALARDQQPTHVVLDLNLGDETTQDQIALLRQILPQAVIVILTGYGTIPSTVRAIKDGANHYLCKPVTPEQLEAALADTEVVPLARGGDASLWDLENDHIVHALEACGGNISQTAKRLGLHRRTLQRRLKKIDYSV